MLVALCFYVKSEFLWHLKGRKENIVLFVVTQNVTFPINSHRTFADWNEILQFQQRPLFFYFVYTELVLFHLQILLLGQLEG